MDERTRQVFERTYEILNQGKQREREHKLWLERHRDPITGGIDLGEDETQPEPTQQHTTSEELVYKTYRQPTPQKQQSAATMDAATQAGWDKWLKTTSRSRSNSCPGRHWPPLPCKKLNPSNW